MPSYDRLPVAFERGEGVWVWDADGRRYLDALGGIAVSVLGHAHPAVTRALAEQAQRLAHTSNLYRVPAQERLAERLTALSGMESAFFANSGAEANEAAFKLARLYGHARGIAAPEIIVAEGAFHGRTLAALSASGGRKVQAGFEPLVHGFVRVPYDDLEAIVRVARQRPSVVAVLVEPIQGEAGVIVPDGGYLAGIRRLCDEHGWLMMLDEIQTGNGRTGRWFAWQHVGRHMGQHVGQHGGQHAGAQPDVMTLAKGLANGVPIGACLARGAAAELFQPGSHGSTFGGNPLACAASLAVLEVIERENLLARVEAMGRRLREGLEGSLDRVAGVRDIRGQGLMLGVELEHPCRELARAALERGLLVNVTAERVVRLLPPLIMGEREIDQVVNLLAESVTEFAASGR